MNGDVTIFWDADADSCDQFLGYNVYGKDKTDVNFTKINSNLIDDFTEQSYFHESNGAGLQNWEYYIEYIFDCGGTKSRNSTIKKIDKEEPDRCEIDTVSVDGNSINISWKKSNSNDVKYYIIYYVQSNDINQNIDTVYYYESLFYTDDLVGDPKSKSEKYRIVAVDSCNNFSEISKEHNTLFLGISQDFCKKEIQLSWNHYEAWEVSNREYEIIVDNKVIEKVDGSRSSYAVKGLENNNSYCFKVRVHHTVSNFSSSSNEACLTTSFVENPEYIYLNYVSIDQDRVALKWNIEKEADIESFSVQRGNRKVTTVEIAEIGYTGGTEFFYNDININVDEELYYYRVDLINTCNDTVLRSNVSRNILLTKDSDNGNYVIRWNPYEYWSGGIEEQIIFMKEEGGWTELKTLSDVVNSYNEGLSSSKLKGRELCFYILNKEGTTNVYGFKEESRSNEVCITGGQIFFIPNAFYPESSFEENRVFRPLGGLLDKDKSRMLVYDRWGKELYNGNIIDGWDGANYPAGVYMYIIFAIGENGVAKKYTGKVTLLR